MEVERPNVWIALAPYFVPLYALIWIGLYGVLCFWNGARRPVVVYVFHVGLGVSYAFHIVLTAHALMRQQQDLRLYGPVFSLSLILFGNVALLFLALVVTGRHWQSAPALLGERLCAQWHLLVAGCRLPYRAWPR